jgi:hypothetical protein
MDAYGRQLRALRARLHVAFEDGYECTNCAGEVCQVCFGCRCTPCDCPEKDSAWVE